MIMCTYSVVTLPKFSWTRTHVHASIYNFAIVRLAGVYFESKLRLHICLHAAVSFCFVRDLCLIYMYMYIHIN